MSDIGKKHRAAHNDYVGAFGQQPGRTGAAFLVGTTFASLDLFAHEATYAALRPKLMRPYADNALELDAKTPLKPSAALAQRLVADLVPA